MGIVFSDVYPGSISDREITSKTLSYVEESNERSDVLTEQIFEQLSHCVIFRNYDFFVIFFKQFFSELRYLFLCFESNAFYFFFIPCSCF